MAKKPFKCKTCGKSFGREDHLRRHDVIHTGGKPYKCSQCYKRFNYRSSCLRHERLHTGMKSNNNDLSVNQPGMYLRVAKHPLPHNVTSRVECKLCGKYFKCARDLIIHNKTHKVGNSYKCNKCGKGFCKPSQYIHHYRTHTGEKPFKCKHCGKCFNLKGNCQRHERLHKRVNITQSITLKQAKNTQQQSKVKEKRVGNYLKCNNCGKCFTHAANRRQHERIHSRVNITQPTTLKQAQNTLQQCDKCGKCFTQAANLRRHERIHTGEKPYKCNYCYKLFSDSGNCLRHQRLHNGVNVTYTTTQHSRNHAQNTPQQLKTSANSVKSHKCKQCNKSFFWAYDLKRHERTHREQKQIHTKETFSNSSQPTRLRGMHYCKQCGKSFSFIANLKRHYRLHTGEKPYKCKHCGKCYSDSSNLRCHEKQHEGKKLQCKHCDKCFSDLRTCQQHEEKHTGDKKSTRRNQRGTHFTQRATEKKISAGSQRKHTKHQCEQCGKQFRDAWGLKRHSKTHNNNNNNNRKRTNEKPFKCKYCDTCFGQLRNCKRHEQRQHPGVKPASCNEPDTHSTQSATGRETSGGSHSVKSLTHQAASVQEDKSLCKDESYPCWICQEELDSEASLKEHYDNHMISN